MSNSSSILHNYDIPVQSPDFNLVQSALQFKQNKLDTNRAKIQAVADQFSMLDVAKDVDKEYVDKRLQAVVDITNKYASGDLSSNSLTNSLLQNINQVADDNVKNAVLSTRLYRSEQNEWEKAKKDNPDKYSQLNHAYASQGAGAWLNDETVGKRYNGGGGFIEYRDLSKKLMDNIGKLQDNLKAKWVTTGPGQGYFQSQDTYEAVDRGKLNQALDMLYDEKDRQQMGINAWGTYKQATPEQMQQDWNSLNAPELEKAQRDLESAKALQGTAEYSSPEKRAQLNNVIQEKQQTIASIQDNDFNNVYNTYGHDGASKILYQAKLKDSILDAYSYEPRLIDRKLDEVSAENTKFQYKVQQDQIDNDLATAKYELEVDKYLYPNKTTKEAAKETLGTILGTGITTGALQELNIPEGSTVISENRKVEKQAWEGIKSLGVTFVGKDSYSKTANELSNLEGKLKNNDSVTIGGKTIKVTADSIIKLRDFRDQVLNTSAGERELHSQFDKTLYGNNGGQSVLGTLKVLAEAQVKGRGSDFNIYDLPKFNWKLEYDKKSDSYKKVDSETSHPYANILAKQGSGKKLTNGEQKTLEAYVAIHAIGDGDLNVAPEVRAEMYKNLKFNTLSKMKGSEFAKIAPSVNTITEGFQRQKQLATKQVNIEGTTAGRLEALGVPTVKVGFTNTVYQVPRALEDSARKLEGLYKQLQETPNDQNVRSNIKNLENSIKASAGLVAQQGEALSNITSYDTEYYNKRGKEISVRGLDDLLNESLGTNLTTSGLNTQFKHLSYTNPLVDSTNPNYQGLKNLLLVDGKVVDSYKGQIEVKPIIGDDNRATGNYYIKAFITEKGKPVTKYVNVSQQELDKTGFKLSPIERKHYDANQGEHANRIDLGKGTGASKVQQNDILYQNFDRLVAEARDQDSPEVLTLLKQYYNGSLNFSLEASNGTYNKVIKDGNGNVLFSEPSEDVTYNDEDYLHIVKNSDNIASNTMFNYITNVLGQTSTLGKINQAERDINQKLGL